MSIPKKHVRGANDIPTMSGAVAETFRPHKAYMRIACLELEKARREEERSSAAFRIANIDARSHEIETEKADLLRKMEDQDGDSRIQGMSAAPENAAASRQGPFRLKY